MRQQARPRRGHFSDFAENLEAQKGLQELLTLRTDDPTGGLKSLRYLDVAVCGSRRLHSPGLVPRRVDVVDTVLRVGD